MGGERKGEERHTVPAAASHPAQRHASLPTQHALCTCLRHPRSIAALVQRHGWGDGGQWLANWEAVWQFNLDACGPGPEGECIIS